jgi:hypothetical protein
MSSKYPSDSYPSLFPSPTLLAISLFSPSDSYSSLFPSPTFLAISLFSHFSFHIFGILLASTLLLKLFLFRPSSTFFSNLLDHYFRTLYFFQVPQVIFQRFIIFFSFLKPRSLGTLKISLDPADRISELRIFFSRVFWVACFWFLNFIQVPQAVFQGVEISSKFLRSVFLFLNVFLNSSNRKFFSSSSGLVFYFKLWNFSKLVVVLCWLLPIFFFFEASDKIWEFEKYSLMSYITT